ncbi:hypothetical protein FLLO111716_00295 [Flavobacterium longum]|uniref:T9SS type A sorting domain-containing protein n=1 Tax=Flavobacterium longum TaxID=1299340 RepID=UPI0039E8CD90
MKNFTLALLCLCANWAMPQLSLTPFQPETPGQFNFGSSLDASGNNAIVTAWNGSVMGQQQVFIFENNGTDMNQVAAFTPADGQISDAYGASVCISGDWAAVGAPYCDEGAENSGAVYVYRKNNGVWQFYLKVTPPSGAMANEHFGSKLKMAGFWMFVGAPGYTANNFNSGAIYIYALSPSGPDFDHLIYSVSNDGIGQTFGVDYNQLAYYSHNSATGTHDVDVRYYDDIAGSFWDSQGGTSYMTPDYDIQQIRLDNGNLYVGGGTDSALNDREILVYHPDENGFWIEEAAIPCFLPNDDNFLTDFDVSGDHMLIGKATYLLLMPRKSPTLYYKKTDGVWTYQETLNGNGAEGFDDAFGAHIAMSPDLFVVGAPIQSQPNYGKAYAINASLGLSNPNRTSSVWPNPTNENIFFSSASESVESAEIYAVNGVLVKTIHAPGDRIDFTDLTPGVYFLKLFTAGRTLQTHKIVKL